MNFLCSAFVCPNEPYDIFNEIEVPARLNCEHKLNISSLGNLEVVLCIRSVYSNASFHTSGFSNLNGISFCISCFHVCAKISNTKAVDDGRWSMVYGLLSSEGERFALVEIQDFNTEDIIVLGLQQAGPCPRQVVF